MPMKDYDEVAKQQLKADVRASRLRNQNIDDAVGALLQARNGRDFLWWLLEIGKVGLQPFARDPIFMGFNCGELNVGQQVLDRIVTVNPEGYLRMLKERQDDADARANADAGTGDTSELDRDDSRGDGPD